MDMEIGSYTEKGRKPILVKRLVTTLKYVLAERLIQDPYYRKKKTYPDYLSQDFDARDAINNTNGKIVELGGPTPDDYTSLGLKLSDLDREVTITNIISPTPDTNMEVSRVDVRFMPYKKGSLGAIFSTGLPSSEYPFMLHGASRCLEDGGFLIMQHILPSTIGNAMEMGFKPKVVKKVGAWTSKTGVLETYNAIFQKSEIPHPNKS